MLAERVELHGVPGQFDGHERQGLRVGLLPGGGGQRGGEQGVVEGRLAGARRRVDQHEPPAGAIAHRVPETGASLDPLRPDLVADDELARAGGSAEELLRGLVVLSGAHSFCPFSVSVSGMREEQRCAGGRVHAWSWWRSWSLLSECSLRRGGSWL